MATNPQQQKQCGEISHSVSRKDTEPRKVDLKPKTLLSAGRSGRGEK
jgi:hypothetical protein